MAFPTRLKLSMLFLLLATLVFSPISHTLAQNGANGRNLEGGWMGKDTLVNTDSIWFHVGEDEGLTAIADAIKFKRINSVQTWCRLDSLSGSNQGILEIQASGKRARPGDTDRSWITIATQTVTLNGAVPQFITFEDNIFTPNWLRVQVSRTTGTASTSCECWVTVKEAFKH